MTLPEPDDRQYAAADLDDLFQDRIEREVESLQLASEERDAFRQLLQEHPANSSRSQIRQQLSRGRTPRQIHLNARIRMRCQAVLEEFNRWDVFGPKHQSSSNLTITWNLADKLRQARIWTRQELFYFFRHLADRFQASAELRREFHCILNYAETTLPSRWSIGGVDRGGSEHLVVRQSLAQLGIGQRFLWEDRVATRVSRRGFAPRNQLAYYIRHGTTPETFAPYRPLVGQTLVDLMYLEDVLVRIALAEGPICVDYLKDIFTKHLLWSELEERFLEAIHGGCQKIVKVGSDIWYHRDFPPGPKHRPRRPFERSAPPVRWASAFDLGRGLETLRRDYPNFGELELEEELLRLWRGGPSDLTALRSALAAYRFYYGKAGLTL